MSYNKKWYDKNMENPEFRSKRVEKNRKYRTKAKRETCEKAIAFIGDISRQIPVIGWEKAIDEVMAKYKIIERS